MADERDEIRSRVSIVDLVGRTIRLTKAGKAWKGLCPFHPDKNPSLTVTDTTGRYKCWSCGESGDIFTWVMKTQNVEFGEAIRDLAAMAGVELSRGPATPPSVRQAQLSAMEAALEFFRGQLGKSSAATEYCDRRGLDADVRAEWELGYAPDVGEALAVHLKKTGHSLAECKSIFLVDQDAAGGYFDKFRSRLMFPIRDERGKLVAFGGRILGDGHPKYINSGDTPIYRKSRVLYGLNRARQALQEQKRAVLVEGYLDAIACHRAGLTTAVASLGTALADDHVALLKRWCSEVVLLYDSDEAGQKATDRAAKMLASESLTVRVAGLEDGDDPDTLLRREGPAALRRSVENAVSVLDFSMARIAKRYAPSQEGFWSESVAQLAEAKSLLEIEPHVARLSAQYPGIRNPVDAAAALRKMVDRARRSERRPTAPRRAVSVEHHSSGAGLSSAEVTVLAALLSDAYRDRAWGFVSQSAEVAETSPGLDMFRAIAAAFAESAPEGKPSEWLHLIEPESLRGSLSDVPLDFRAENLTAAKLDDAIELLYRGAKMREVTAMKQSETLDDSKRAEIVERLSQLKSDSKAAGPEQDPAL